MSLKKLNEYRNLRNCISHNTPLNVYLTAGKNKRLYTYRASIITEIAPVEDTIFVEYLLTTARDYIDMWTK